MKQTIKINESTLRKIVAESVKKVLRESNLNEFEAGGTDWGSSYNGTYDSYVNKDGRHNTNAQMDSFVEELHNICRFYDELYGAVYEDTPSKSFRNVRPEMLQYALKNIGPIYGLMANKTNRNGDEHGINMQDIQNLTPNLQALANCNMGMISSSAQRLLQSLKSC